MVAHPGMSFAVAVFGAPAPSIISESMLCQYDGCGQVLNTPLDFWMHMKQCHIPPSRSECSSCNIVLLGCLLPRTQGCIDASRDHIHFVYLVARAQLRGQDSDNSSSALASYFPFNQRFCALIYIDENVHRVPYTTFQVG